MTTKTDTPNPAQFRYPFHHEQAVEYLRAHSGYVIYRDRDATLTHWHSVRCWLIDGELQQLHPTDPGYCAAPTDVAFRAPTPEEIAEDDAANERCAADAALVAEIEKGGAT